MATKLYVFQFQFVIIVVIKQTLLHIKSFVIYYTDRTELHSFCTESPGHLAIARLCIRTRNSSKIGKISVSIHLLCINACFDGSIHILLCMQQFHSKTICEIKYEIAACIINVWGYTEI